MSSKKKNYTMLIVDNKDFVGFQVGFQRETMHCYMFMMPLHSCFCLAALKLINPPPSVVFLLEVSRSQALLPKAAP